MEETLCSHAHKSAPHTTIGSARVQRAQEPHHGPHEHRHYQHHRRYPRHLLWGWCVEFLSSLTTLVFSANTGACLPFRFSRHTPTRSLFFQSLEETLCSHARAVFPSLFFLSLTNPHFACKRTARKAVRVHGDGSLIEDQKSLSPSLCVRAWVLFGTLRPPPPPNLFRGCFDKFCCPKHVRSRRMRS